MAKIKVYSYKKCSTCVKALKFLAKKNVTAEVVDIIEEPPSRDELEIMLKSYEGELKRLFNTSGQVYRDLNIKDQLPVLSKAEAFKLLSKNGKLVKRPFLIKGKQGRVGFKEDEWKSFI